MKHLLSYQDVLLLPTTKKPNKENGYSCIIMVELVSEIENCCLEAYLVVVAFRYK